jgi:hypothetical protein
MVNFMENNQEQRIASDYFLKSGKAGIASIIVTACINRNPVMIYSGQEFGERGMDEEGYSGKNGRTTLFDYWSVDTLRRWNNHGKWDDELLEEEEKRLHKFYSKLMTLCNHERALSQGLFYDLMPANYENSEFDSARQFAFVRSDEKDIILIVVNFDRVEKNIRVCIPDHVYSFFGIDRLETGIIRPLLDENTKEIFFSPENPLTVKIKSNSGEIFKFHSL